MNTFAIDYETYYDKECSIRTLGVLGYFSHPNFDAYMVSVVGTEGTNFVGHPKEFDWSLLDGNVVLSHNASFDETLFLYGVSQNWWDDCDPAEWHCTADLAAYCKLPRSLKGSTAQLFNLTVDKSTRDNMSGKRWEDMSPEFKDEVSEYALKDSELCLRLWETLKDQWPQFERDISRVNRKIVQRGIPIDTDLLKKQLETINQALFEAEQNIPWLDEKPLLSRAAFDQQCLLLGITPPHSLAEADEDAQKWIEEHREEHKWIGAVKSWRRINSIKKKLESFDYATMPDSRYYGGCMYFGAHTGRFSGSGGNLNLQNLPREEMFGVNLRHLICPEPDKKLIVVDLSQIEVRTLCWLAKDHEMMEEIKNTDDIYEAFAIRFGMWDEEKGILKKEDPEKRHAVKAMVLGCGYGAGAKRFASMSSITEEEAQKRVDTYRQKMRKIKSLWYEYSEDIKGSVSVTGGYDADGKRLHAKFTVDLPSGRVLDYGTLQTGGDPTNTQYTAKVPRHGKYVPVRLWGGLVAENASQALARDIFSDMLLRVDKAGYNIVMHVHDEMVVEADATEAEEVLHNVIKIMSEPPEWISDIPVAAEGSIQTRYEK
jgi:DNA polymerase I-like protein with 3'-5' exonuclease and polymerase domains